MKFNRFFLLAICASLLTACPYPVYKKLRPDGTAMILDSSGKPVTGAKVVILTRTYPTPIHEYDIKITDENGLASFASRREMQTEVVFLHGSVEYYWNWCVEKSGYKTYETGFSNGDEFTEQLKLTLLAGDSTTCAPNDHSK
jgi:hypothetical protein